MDPAHSELALHTDALRRFTRGLCCGEAEAEDVSQDVLMAALEAPGKRHLSWPQWLRGAGRNVARSRMRSDGRRRRREQASARSEAVPSAAERAARLELEARLIEFVSDLPDSQSEVLYLRYWQDLPPRAIAARLNLSTEAVKSRLKRALAALRARLTEETPGGHGEWMAALGFVPLTAPATKGALVGTIAGGVLMKKVVVLVAITLAVAGLWILRSAGVGPGTIASATPPSAEVVELADSLPVEPTTPETSSRIPAATPPLPANATVITGRLVNHPAGQPDREEPPSAGVSVQLGQFTLGSDGARAEAVTEEDGSFRLELIHDWEGERSFTASVDGDERYGWVSHELRLTGEKPGSHEVVLERYAYGDLQGTTVDPSGDALAGVEIRVEDEQEVRAISDDFGAFRIARMRPLGWSKLQARKSGWVAVESPHASPRPDGTWPDVRLVLSPSGALRVRVEDAAGRPLEGVNLSLAPSPAEKYGNERASPAMGRHVVLQAQTSAEGEVHFPEVWSDLKLRIGMYSEANALFFERERDGRALPLGELDSGRPLLVELGSERTVVVRMAQVCRITGQVLSPDLTPLADAYVQLHSVEHRFGAPAFVRMDGRTDEEGRFELLVRSLAPVGAAVLYASDTRGQFFSWAKDADPQVASMPLDLGQDREDLTLVLEPTAAISGRVVGPDGEGVKAKITATPLAGELVQGLLPTGFSGSIYCEKTGEFHIAGLPEGSFELAVHHSDHAPVHLSDVAGGTRDLLIRLEGGPTVTVEIEVLAPGHELDEVIVLRGRLRPHDESVVVAPDLPARARYLEPFGWPQTALGLWYGSEGETTELGRVTYQYWPIKGTSTSLGVREGYYWFGAKARTKTGALLHPIGTGLVRVTPGVHQLQFVLSATASVEGRVLGIPPGVELQVALATHDGRLLALNVRREDLSTLVELGAAGTFLLASVPEGDYELRVGTRSELLEGQSRLRRAIEVRAGEQLRLELEL